MNKEIRWFLFFIGVAVAALFIAAPVQQPSPIPAYKSAPMTGFENGAIIEVRNMKEAKEVIEGLGLEVQENEEKLYCKTPMTKSIWLILMGHRSVRSITPKTDSVSSPIR